jgi:hypothetical protein
MAGCSVSGEPVEDLPHRAASVGPTAGPRQHRGGAPRGRPMLEGSITHEALRSCGSSPGMNPDGYDEARPATTPSALGKSLTRAFKDRVVMSD